MIILDFPPVHTESSDFQPVSAVRGLNSTEIPFCDDEPVLHTIVTTGTSHLARIRSFRSMYKRLGRSEPEIYSTDSFFYPTKERNNSLFFEKKRPWNEMTVNHLATKKFRHQAVTKTCLFL